MQRLIVGIFRCAEGLGTALRARAAKPETITFFKTFS
jgi:hypothetical protein